MKVHALVATAVALTWAASSADAKSVKASPKASAAKLAGVWKVKFEPVVDSCQGTGVSIDRGKIKITRKKTKRGKPAGAKLTVNVPLIPNMRGAARSGLRFQAKARKGPSMIRGLLVRPNVSGRIVGGILQAMVVADYFRGRRAYCTQSWKVSGVRYVKKKR